MVVGLHKKVHNHKQQERKKMVSMINQLKRNVMQPQFHLQPTGVQPTQQPMQNPHMGYINSLQQQKELLEKERQNMMPASNALSSAAMNIMNAGDNESPMAILAKGIMGAAQGLKGYNQENKENLRQQGEIDKVIANTYHFVQDYEYNKQITRETMDMKREELNLKRDELGVKNMNSQRQLMHEMNKQGLEQQKFGLEKQKHFEEASKDITQAYNQSKDLMKNVNEIERLLNTKIKDWSPMAASLTGNLPDTVLPVVSRQDMAQWALLKKNLNELQTKYTQSFGNHNRLTNSIVEMVKSGKIDIPMGKEAMQEALRFIKGNLSKSMERDQFALDAMRKGIDKDLALRAYDEYLEKPEEYKNPTQALYNIYNNQQTMFEPNYSRGANVEDQTQIRKNKAKKAAQDLFGGE